MSGCINPALSENLKSIFLELQKFSVLFEVITDHTACLNLSGKMGSGLEWVLDRRMASSKVQSTEVEYEKEWKHSLDSGDKLGKA